MLETIENTSGMNQATLSEANSHEYLVRPIKIFQALYLNFKSALDSFATHNNIRVFLCAVFSYPLILYLFYVFLI